MFIRKNRLRKDLPAIDIREKPVRGLFGNALFKDLVDI